MLGTGRSSYYFCTQKRLEGHLKQENRLLKQVIIRIYPEQDGIMEGRYNRNRIHSATGYRIPQQIDDFLSISANLSFLLCSVS